MLWVANTTAVPPAGQRRDELPQPLALTGVKRGRRLVQEQRVGLRQQPDADVDALLVAAGQGPDLVVAAVLQPDLLRASARAAASGSGSFSSRANRRRFSITDSFEYTAGCWGTHPSRSLGRSGPASPSLGSSTPARIDSSVVLPAPLGPMMATISPGMDLKAHRTQRHAGPEALAHRGDAEQGPQRWWRLRPTRGRRLVDQL